MTFDSQTYSHPITRNVKKTNYATLYFPSELFDEVFGSEPTSTENVNVSSSSSSSTENVNVQPVSSPKLEPIVEDRFITNIYRACVRGETPFVPSLILPVLQRRVGFLPVPVITPIHSTDISSSDISSSDEEPLLSALPAGIDPTISSPGFISNALLLRAKRNEIQKYEQDLKKTQGYTGTLDPKKTIVGQRS